MAAGGGSGDVDGTVAAAQQKLSVTLFGQYRTWYFLIGLPPALRRRR
jgi:hypothetical protein